MSYATTESEHLGKLNYHNSFPLTEFLDVARYEREGEYFHTVDQRFHRVWRLSGISSEILNEDDKIAVANAFAHALNQYPIGTTGQLIRYKHGDIRPTLHAFVAEHSESPFAEPLLNSIVERQLGGALDAHGFFANITSDMEQQALADELDELEEPVARDQASRKVEKAASSGRYAHVTELLLVFSYTPFWATERLTIPNLLHRMRLSMGGGDADEEYRRIYIDERRTFLKHASRIEQNLLGALMEPEVVTGQGLVDILYREMNPERAYRTQAPTYRPSRTLRETVAAPDLDESERDLAKSVLFSPVNTLPTGFQIGEVHYQVASLRDMPEQTEPGKLLEPLAHIQGESWTVINFSVPGQTGKRLRVATRKKMLTSKEQLAETGAKFVKVDRELLAKQKEHLEMIQNATNPEERNPQLIFDASYHMAVKGRDPLAVEEKVTTLEDHMFTFGYREVDRGDAILHSMLPLNFKVNGQKALSRAIETLSPNMADMAPLFTSYQGVFSPSGMLVNNADGEPVFIDLFGPHVVAGHSLIIGGTGSGKSFFVNNLLSQYTAKTAPKVFMIDKGGSYRAQCESQGGSYIMLSVDEEDEDATPTCLNPFYLAPDAEGKPRVPRVSEISFMHRCIMAMILSGTGEETGVSAGLEKEDSTLLLRALRDIFKHKKNQGTLNEELTLTEYVRHLETYTEGKDRGPELASKLFEFTSAGIYGGLFDGPLQVNWDSDMIVIETDKLDGTDAMPVAMLVLFYQIDSYCKYRLPKSRQKIFGIDEAWAALSDPITARIVGGFYREMRKYNTACLLISQSVGDFLSLVHAESGKGQSGIMVNTKHFFLLSCSADDLKMAEADMKMPAEEISCWGSVSSLPPFYSECFYRCVLSNDDVYAGKFRLYSNPVALWMSSTQPKDTDLRTSLLQQKAKEQGLSRNDATREAIIELAQRYPYGSKFRVQNDAA